MATRVVDAHRSRIAVPQSRRCPRVEVFGQREGEAFLLCSVQGGVRGIEEADGTVRARQEVGIGMLTVGGEQGVGCNQAVDPPFFVIVSLEIRGENQVVRGGEGGGKQGVAARCFSPREKDIDTDGRGLLFGDAPDRLRQFGPVGPLYVYQYDPGFTLGAFGVPKLRRQQVGDFVIADPVVEGIEVMNIKGDQPQRPDEEEDEPGDEQRMEVGGGARRERHVVLFVTVHGREP